MKDILRIAANGTAKTTPGAPPKVRVCPVCGRETSPSHMAVRSHLRTHVRAKELTEDEARDIAMKMDDWRKRKI